MLTPLPQEVTARRHCLQTRKLVLPRHQLRQGLDLGLPRFQTVRNKSVVYRLPCLECLLEPPGAPKTNTRFAALCESCHRKAKTEGLSALTAQQRNPRSLQVRMVGMGPEPLLERPLGWLGWEGGWNHIRPDPKQSVPCVQGKLSNCPQMYTN